MSTTLTEKFKKDNPTVDDKSVQLAVFIKWIGTVPRDHLERLLADALWQDHMKDSELVRCFVVEADKGIRMMDREPGVLKRCTASGCHWFGANTKLSRTCPLCKGKLEPVFE